MFTKYDVLITSWDKSGMPRVQCSKHLGYKGKSMPKSDCIPCWRIFERGIALADMAKRVLQIKDDIKKKESNVIKETKGKGSRNKLCGG